MKEVFYIWNNYILKCFFDSEQLQVDDIEIMGKGWAKKIAYSQEKKMCKMSLHVVTQRDKKGVEVDGNNYYLFLSGNDLEKSEMLPCVMLHIYLREMLADNILPFHASGFVYNGKKILLLSETEGGKTAVMYDLCRNHGAQFISNDFFAGKIQNGIVSKVVDDQDSLISYRKDLFTGDIESVPIVFKGNENRKYFTSKELELTKFCHDGTYSIDYICWVEVTDIGETTKYRMSEPESIFRYHYNIINILSGVSLMLFDAEGNWISHLPTYLNGDVLKHIYQLIDEMCKHYKPIEYVGDLKYIVREIISGVNS